MSAPGNFHRNLCGDAGPLPRTATDECPFCGAPACSCDDADFFEILAEQQVHSDE